MMRPRKLPLRTISRHPRVLSRVVATPPLVYPDDVINFAVEAYGRDDSSAAHDIRAVAGELIANAIEHGNQRDPTKTIGVYCLRLRNFYVAVTDEGEGFDVCKPPFVPGRSGVPPEGGIGLAFVKFRTVSLYNDGSAVIAVF